ncbi:hypothetical protein ACTXI4_16580 [Glutamicibacter ardleyensis]|uniref:hypothetical protein n=1 Tax=Glutamicibacter ardleyensis TaxID=225894 RepID=UPI003FCFF13A
MPTQRELQRELLARNPQYSAGQAKAVAKKMIYIEKNVGFENLRILGLTSDPTSREAVRNIEEAERKKKKTAPVHPRQEIRTEAVTPTP